MSAPPRGMEGVSYFMCTGTDLERALHLQHTQQQRLALPLPSMRAFDAARAWAPAFAVLWARH